MRQWCLKQIKAFIMSSDRSCLVRAFRHVNLCSLLYNSVCKGQNMLNSQFIGGVTNIVDYQCCLTSSEKFCCLSPCPNSKLFSPCSFQVELLEIISQCSLYVVGKIVEELSLPVFAETPSVCVLWSGYLTSDKVSCMTGCHPGESSPNRSICRYLVKSLPSHNTGILRT